MSCPKLWLVDVVIARYCFPPRCQWSKNLMNHSCRENSQPKFLSSRRSKSDAIIARMEARVKKLLFAARYVTCTYVWLKRETFSEESCKLTLQLHCSLYNFMNKNYSCVDSLVAWILIRQIMHGLTCSHCLNLFTLQKDGW